MPCQRGNGCVDDLLRHAAAVLQAIGIWRVHSGTDVLNVPMAGAFERVGCRRVG